MLEILTFENDSIVGMRIDGAIEDQQNDAVIALVEKKLETNNNLKLYTEVIQIGGISPETFFSNLSFKLQHFSDFDKSAIVSDNQWLNQSIGFMSHFIPNIEIKAFSLSEKESALQWLNE